MFGWNYFKKGNLLQVKEKGQFDYLIPPTIARNEELKAKFEAFMGEVSKNGISDFQNSLL